MKIFSGFTAILCLLIFPEILDGIEVIFSFNYCDIFRGIDYNNEYCDLMTECDPYFIVRLKGYNDQGTLILHRYQKTNRVQNTNYFNKVIVGFTENVTSYPKSIFVEIEIWDHDSLSSDDLIFNLKSNYYLYGSRIQKSVSRFNALIKFDIIVLCGTNYYGIYCENYCIKSPGISYCDSNGNSICSLHCGNGACIKINGRFQCHCNNGWYGDHCTKQVLKISTTKYSNPITTYTGIYVKATSEKFHPQVSFLKSSKDNSKLITTLIKILTGNVSVHTKYKELLSAKNKEHLTSTRLTTSPSTNVNNITLFVNSRNKIQRISTKEVSNETTQFNYYTETNGKTNLKGFNTLNSIGKSSIDRSNLIKTAIKNPKLKYIYKESLTTTSKQKISSPRLTTSTITSANNIILILSSTNKIQRISTKEVSNEPIKFNSTPTIRSKEILTIDKVRKRLPTSSKTSVSLENKSKYLKTVRTTRQRNLPFSSFSSQTTQTSSRILSDLSNKQNQAQINYQNSIIDKKRLEQTTETSSIVANQSSYLFSIISLVTVITLIIVATSLLKWYVIGNNITKSTTENKGKYV